MNVRRKSMKVPPAAKHFWEAWYPLLVSVVITLISIILKHQQKKDLATDLAGPLLNVLAITVGFVAAVMTFLLTAQQSPVLASLHPTRQFSRLIRFHWDAIKYGFVACLLSVALIGMLRCPYVMWRSWAFHIWVFGSSLALLLFFRVVDHLRGLLQPDADEYKPLPEIVNEPRPD